MLASELRAGTRLNRAAVRPPDFFRKRRAGNFAIMGRHAIAPAVVEAVCPAVLVPVLRGIQRQFSQDRARFRNPVPVGQGRLGSPDHARERGLHRALLLSVRLGGQLADRYDKAKVAQRLKFAEIFIAAFAVIGYARSSLPILFVALFAFGVLAALFGPIKYGILPDHLRREQLPSGNALIEGATFVAILLGTIAAGLASRGGETATFAALVISFALACWVSALLIPATG